MEVRHAPVMRHSPARRSPRAGGFAGVSGPTYVFKCPVCGKTFNKKSYGATLNKHTNSRTGYECYGTFGTYVRTKYQRDRGPKRRRTCNEFRGRSAIAPVSITSAERR